MKYKKTITSTIVALSLFGATPIIGHALLESDQKIQEETGQPFSSYWYPKELLAWSPNNDKDAKFNIGTVPLQARTKGDVVKNSQDDEAKVISLAIANKTTSSTPSQGKTEFEGYNFSYWQYIDTLVAWGGSAGEGLIVPPSADIIDSAHTNGVPVLGTVFFPPEDYGGKFEWMHEFLVKDKDGNFPMAHKLVEVAQYYNFDGWFINQETGNRGSDYINPELADLMKEFLEYLQKIKPKNMEIVWYDSMIDDGRVFWQNRLNQYNKNFLGEKGKELSDSMFLNFWWTEDRYSVVDPNNDDNRLIYNVTGNELKESGDLAKKMGRDKYDLYAGVDVQANGYNTPIKWNYLFPKNQEANTSLGLYCPSWTYDSSKTVDEFLQKESRFWVNEKGDPRSQSSEDWKGISNNIVEKSPITQLPFVTNFSMGNGEFFNVDGVQVSEKDWNHRGMMDILPTYRWIIDNNKNNLTANIDYKNAYYGGNSIGINGSLANGGTTKVKLFATDLELTNNSEVSIKYKESGGNSNIKLEFELDNGENKIINLESKQSGEWIDAKASLSQFKKSKIKEISLIIEGKESSSSYNLNLGQISVNNKNTKDKVSKIKNLKVEDFKVIDNYYGNARLTWDKSEKNISHYEIYLENSDGHRELVGATPTNAFYVKDIERDLQLDSKTNFIVKPVSNLFKSEEKNESKITVKWPDLEAPKADFEVSSPIVLPGQSVNFKDKSLAGETVKWKIEGLNKNEEVTGNEVSIKFDKPGVYSVTQIVSNPAGDTVNKKDDYIVVSSQAKDGLKNLALNKEAIANAKTNENEDAKFAFDGKLNSKWCALGESGNYIQVDLGKENIIKQLRISHAEAGGEAKSMNTSQYNIEVSNDGQSWRKVKDVSNNSSSISNDDLNYELARYIKVNINKSEQGSGGATRIYEIEALGLDTNKITVIDNKEALVNFINKVNELESLYKDLGTTDENFEKILYRAKQIIEIVEVDKEEILNVQNDLEDAFNEIKNT
ncbi:endo-beta-N-acetylglucosaminidase [Paraclostridium bifermentans]|uniref:endo-beta-N-acetylglucosaminidase n=1 Tax=Paraclostridium bifermentans TaxID=1490 RepID=UPI0021C49B9E|nr:discoidin domain-containing protein [Paraclostridium bifermentans]GKZ03692.1 endo-beta-N-acetylglucosaminidase [Paraclostridium bifermentans]GKZ08468.1 endo-beta-N-acetylglucosaminidase [Paraclostridium bifermentans]GKZ10400.1 endo-beta-N-acetylglucosaminidase [Paraclostridium bifermentans]